MIMQVGNKGHDKNGTLHNNCCIKALYSPKINFKDLSLNSSLIDFNISAIQLVLIKILKTNNNDAAIS